MTLKFPASLLVRSLTRKTDVPNSSISVEQRESSLASLPSGKEQLTDGVGAACISKIIFNCWPAYAVLSLSNKSLLIFGLMKRVLAKTDADDGENSDSPPLLMASTRNSHSFPSLMCWVTRKLVSFDIPATFHARLSRFRTSTRYSVISPPSATSGAFHLTSAKSSPQTATSGFLFHYSMHK